MSQKDTYLRLVEDQAGRLKEIDDHRASVRADFLTNCLRATEHGATQSEIAARTHFSRQRISQFLAEARKAA